MTTKLPNLVERSLDILPEVIKWRRHFHQFPELSFQEKATSEKIAQILDSFGAYSIEKNIGGYGIVATLTTGDGPVIALRADMDALPIYEQTGLSYSSKHPGVMHACGHDAHISILLGAAKLLAEDANKGLFKGSVKLIFQPAEEDSDVLGETGAVKMLQCGVLDDVDAVLALHMCPWRKKGEIQIHDGPSMANNDDFYLIVKGIGGHGGYPHHTKDPIWMSTYLLQALYSINGRKVNPLDVGTISVGQIHAGEANNVIPGLVEIQGTIRSYKKEVRELLIKEMEGAARVVTALGGDFDLTVHRGEPALVNDPTVNKVIRDAAADMKVINEPFGMGSEDFSHMTARKPGAMFFLGCGIYDERGLHHPGFDINEEALSDGVEIFLKCVYQLLQREGGEL